MKTDKRKKKKMFQHLAQGQQTVATVEIKLISLVTENKKRLWP